MYQLVSTPKAMKTMRKFLFGLGLSLTALTAHAAPAGNAAIFTVTDDDPCSKTGPDGEKAKIEYSLYREFYKQENFVDALPHWKYIFRNAPGLSKNTFTNGVKMYSDLADAEQDSVIKQQLVDTLIKIYRKRIECFGESDKVLGYMAYDMYKYRPERHGFVYGAFKEALDEGGENTEYYLLYPFFQYTVLMWSKGKFTDDEVLATYDLLESYSDANIRKAEAAGNQEDVQNWTGTKAKIEEKLPRGLLTCEKLIVRLERDREMVMGDLNELKKAYNNLKLAPPDSITGARCTENPIFSDIVLKIAELEPSASLLSDVGEIMWQRGDRDGALDAWNKSIEMETDTDKKASLALVIARVFQREKQFARSRDYARKAISYRSGWGDPYILIGDLYASSGSVCDGMDAELCALAALDKYAQAKSVDGSAAADAQDRINKYSQYMPTKTYLFERNLNEGDSYTFGCWIGETTTLRGKKSN